MQKIKIGLLGSGKTGSEVQKILEKRQDFELIVYNSKNHPIESDLAKCQALIAFVPGEVFLKYLPMLTSSGICVISGCTGLHYPENFEKICRDKKQMWVQGSNFSLTMIFIKKALASLGQLKKISPHFKFQISETHHTKKLDSPSGTSLNFKKWLGEDLADTEIISHRKGDIVGEHQLLISSSFESIKLEHLAHQRSLFAEGAVWTLDFLLKNENWPKKFYHFEDLVLHSLQ